MKRFIIRKIKCSGLFCDQQAVVDRAWSTDECGRYGIQSQKSSLALVFDLKIKNDVTDVECMM